MTADYATRLPSTDIISSAEFELFIDAFLSRWNGNSRAAYDIDLRMYFGWCAEHGDLHPLEAKRIHIEAFVRYLTDSRGNQPRSVNRRITTLRQFYDIAIDDDYVVKNPCRNVRLARPKLDLAKKVHLNREETQRFLRAAYDTSASEYAMCALMAYLGLRVSEVCDLNVVDVLHYSKGHRVILFVGKNGDPATVPQPPVIMRALDAVIDSLEDPQGPLIVRRDGTRMTRRSADRVLKRCAKAAGITSVTVSPHTLRHTFVVGALDAGASPRTVQLSARHADISTTLSTYDRGRQALDDHAAYIVAGYFGSAA